MGKIKEKFIKVAGIKLIDTIGDTSFPVHSFEEIKKIVKKSIANDLSKKMINKLSGFILKRLKFASKNI